MGGSQRSCLLGCYLTCINTYALFAYQYNVSTRTLHAHTRARARTHPHTKHTHKAHTHKAHTQTHHTKHTHMHTTYCTCNLQACESKLINQKTTYPKTFYEPMLLTDKTVQHIPTGTLHNPFHSPVLATVRRMMILHAITKVYLKFTTKQLCNIALSLIFKPLGVQVAWLWKRSW